MRKLNRWLYGSGLLFLVMFLSGCVKTGADGQPTGEGFVYNFLVLPMSNAITYLVDNFNWNYGWAIIFITIIVRIIILPLGLHQSKKLYPNGKNASNQTSSGCCTSKNETSKYA